MNNLDNLSLIRQAKVFIYGKITVGNRARLLFYIVKQ